jgi:hypothetical protein
MQTGNLVNKPLITINEARKLLEGASASLTDAQVEALIVQLDFIATLVVKDHRLTNEKKEIDNND